MVTRLTPEGYDVQVLPAWENFPSDDVTADTALMNERLQGYIDTMPEQYYWVHKRFKSRPDGSPPRVLKNCPRRCATNSGCSWMIQCVAPCDLFQREMRHVLLQAIDQLGRQRHIVHRPQHQRGQVHREHFARERR